MKLVRVSDCCGVQLCSIEFDYVRLMDRSITERSIAFDWQNFFVSSIKFDYRTQSNPIKRLGSITERSISYAGDRLRQVILIDEFKRCIHSDVRPFINEQKAETMEEAARLADDYSLTHKVAFEEKPSNFSSPRGQNLPTALRNPQKENPNQRQTYGCSSRPSSTSFTQNKPAVARKPFKLITCYYCRREGHLMSECPEKLKTRRQQGLLVLLLLHV